MITRRTSATGEYATGQASPYLSHKRPQTFIGVMFVPHRAKSRKFATACAKRTARRDLLKGRMEAA